MCGSRGETQFISLGYGQTNLPLTFPESAVPSTWLYLNLWRFREKCKLLINCKTFSLLFHIYTDYLYIYENCKHCKKKSKSPMTTILYFPAMLATWIYRHKLKMWFFITIREREGDRERDREIIFLVVHTMLICTRSSSCPC